MTMMGPDLLGRLLDEQGSVLVLYARQWCASAEDVVQEAFVKLAGQRVAPDNPAAWLYRVVRNGAISAGRGERRRRSHETAVAVRSAAWFVPSEVKGDVEAVSQALQGLPVEQREVIVAHIWGGRTFEEIAALAGTSVSTAHRWYLAGLELLRERLEVACPKKSL